MSSGLLSLISVILLSCPGRRSSKGSSHHSASNLVVKDADNVLAEADAGILQLHPLYLGSLILGSATFLIILLSK